MEDQSIRDTVENIEARVAMLETRIDQTFDRVDKFSVNVASRLNKLEAHSSRYHPNSREIVFQIEKLAALLADDNTMFAPVNADIWERRLKQHISKYVQLPD